MDALPPSPRAALGPLRKKDGRILVSGTGVSLSPAHLINVLGRELPLGIAKALHGLRKSGAVHFAEVGRSEEEIASIIGHTTFADVQALPQAVAPEIARSSVTAFLENAERTAIAKRNLRRTAKSADVDR